MSSRDREANRRHVAARGARPRNRGSRARCAGARDERGWCAAKNSLKAVAYRSTADPLGGSKDRVDVKAIVPVELADRTRLAEVLDTQRAHAVAANAAQP